MLRILFVLLMLGFTVQTSIAAKNHHSPSPMQVSASAIDQAVFSAAERHIIRAGLLSVPQKQKPTPPPSNLPKGLNKQLVRGHSLPPGWQRKVTLGKRLDCHLYRQAAPLPRDLLQQLPSSPAGTTRLRIGDSILRLEAATRVVLDMFDLHRK